MKLLLVNPNSSAGMTEEIRENIEAYLQSQNGDIPIIDYYTGPKESPPQISDINSSNQSLAACLPELSDASSSHFYDLYDGVLIACFSDHPLVEALSSLAAKDNSSTIVMGLLNSSIAYCSLQVNKAFSILTSNKEWVDILNNSVESKFLTNQSKKYWMGTVSTDLEVLDLHSPENFNTILSIAQKENKDRLGSNLIILGCAGFSALYPKLQEHWRDDKTVRFVEPVTLGIETLIFLYKSM